MDSPIENRIGQVFVPVTDMRRAIDWYSRLLGLPPGEASHGGTIYDVPMQGETRLALDATKPEISNSSQPLFFLWTADIQAARDYLVQQEIDVLSNIEDVGSVSFVLFRDPDRNLLMVCQWNR